MLGQEILQAEQGIHSMGKVLHFVGTAVSGRVIRSTVMSETVRHGLNHDRLLVLESIRTGFAYGRVYRENVISIDANRCHAITRRTGDNSVPCILIRHGGGNGVTVVTTKENDRGL
eukprot:scaffold12163_cov176-Amphora_coffeaeformis.AAC.22